ncbi:MAG: hypothetical protein KU37_04415 [Sulfuricurvum sp. PC08-66]|nr:MAG: hypothetical protein KU37_04415 [Sulfuricurvum sp. PC08-66]
MRLLFLLSFVSTMLFGLTSDDELKLAIIGKVAKFITWEKEREYFTVTFFNNPFGKLPHEMYEGKEIQSKPVRIYTIDNVDALVPTHVLYIGKATQEELAALTRKAQEHNILTISDIRGFAEQDGIVQLFIATQKIRLKINIDNAKNTGIQIKSSLLNIVSVVRKDS